MCRNWKLIGRTSLLLAAAAFGTVVSLSHHAARAQDATRAPDTARACTAPFDLVRLVHPLKRTAEKIAAGQPLTVVAIGSSSTAGAGASAEAMKYPSRLAVELRQTFPGENIRVLNRGVNGEEAREMLDRFEKDVMAEKPDLVLWQVGTNSVLRDNSPATANLMIREGVRRLKASGADVVLIDPQFAPRVIAKPEAEVMVEVISAAAKEANVDVFQRFAVMRHWHERGELPFAAFITPDDLHLNDWGYGCWAKLLGSAITDAANRTQTQSVATRRPQARRPAP